MIGASLVGLGSYLPTQKILNTELEQSLDTSDTWIRERTGIEARHKMAPEETAASMGMIAAKAALDNAQISAQEIDLIIVATATPDKIFPATACLIQSALNIPVCTAFDIQAACSGFVYALGVAAQFIKTGMSRCALVIGSEGMSRLVNWQDRNTCVLFGDGAGAAVLKASTTTGIEYVKLAADGRDADALGVNHWHGVAPEKRSEADFHLYMEGRRVFKFAVNAMIDLLKETLLAKNLSLEDLDWIVPHQANIRILQAMSEKTGFPMEKILCTVAKHSNTSSASIPLALDVGRREGHIRSGQRVLLMGFGSGVTWGAVLLRMP